MSHVSGLQQEDAAASQEAVKPLAHRKLLKLMDLVIRKTRRDTSREITEEDKSAQERPVNVEPSSYKGLCNILQERDVPILVVFYSSKSKRCDSVLDTFQELMDSFPTDKIKFIKFDIEKSDSLLEINHVPTIKLYPGVKDKKKYPVEYFDDPVEVSSYKRFLKEEGLCMVCDD